MTIPLPFATDFDGALAAIPLPVIVGTGADEALQVTDQVHRTVKFVGRFVASGAIGLKVRVEDKPVRVHLRLSLDAKSALGWDLDDIEPPPPCDLLPRFIQVRAQGRARQCLLLMRRPRRRVVCGRVAFDLLPDEVPDDGLIFVEAIDVLQDRSVPDNVRQALMGRVATEGVAGLRIDRVVIEHRPDAAPALDVLDGSRAEASSLTSGGGIPRQGRARMQPLSSRMLMVNPVPADLGRSDGRLGLRLVAGPDPTAKGNRIQRVARRLRIPAQPRVIVAVNPLDGQGIDFTSRVVGKALQVEVPAGIPSLLLFEDRGAMVPLLTRAEWRP